ncbi:hypothetical protein CROQUDRAFT_662479 [Cronartium quercuum f. sp. fusiforme G11]|uniref:Uncharacterized protein n=1 Tax=Cronartium quercuum f. sp. fusiforme G11 TaxID=708437 RepID=A0A9P6NF18_9BASI|nr:hypothetical protein CROQUDRAFT_662479 [Cronartium quercuum f. sp. fusiforme G11]
MESNVSREQLERARELIYPKFPPWALGLLLVAIVFRGIVILGCAIIMGIPVLKGRESRQKHYFLIRPIYGRQRMPYLVPNRCMVITVCELLSSVLYVVSACNNFRFYSEAMMPHGMFIAFCLCNLDGSNNKRSSRILTPFIYNFVWISWSIIVISLTTFWAVATVRLQSKMDSLAQHLLSLLKESTISWDAHQDFSRIPLKAILADRDDMIQNMMQLTRILVPWGKTWLGLAIVLLVFYLLTVQYLLGMLRKLLRMRNTESLVSCSPSGSLIWDKLEEEFRFLSRSSFIVSTTLICQIFVVIYQILSASRLDSRYWRMGSALIPHIVGLTMAPSLLLQSFYVFTARNSAEVSDYHQVEANFKTNNLPQIAAHLLAWNVTQEWFPHTEPRTPSSQVGGK